MTRVLRILAALVAVCVLSAYFFNDLVLTGPPEMMTWEEFSSNPGAVTRFRERVAPGGETLGSEETRRAYERYVSSVNQRSAAAAGVASSNSHVDAWKERWRRLYRAFVPKKYSTRRGGASPISDETRHRIGMLLVLAIVVGCVGLTTALLKVCEGRARV